MEGFVFLDFINTVHVECPVGATREEQEAIAMKHIPNGRLRSCKLTHGMVLQIVYSVQLRVPLECKGEEQKSPLFTWSFPEEMDPDCITDDPHLLPIDMSSLFPKAKQRAPGVCIYELNNKITGKK